MEMFVVVKRLQINLKCYYYRSEITPVIDRVTTSAVFLIDPIVVNFHAFPHVRSNCNVDILKIIIFHSKSIKFIENSWIYIIQNSQSFIRFINEFRTPNHFRLIEILSGTLMIHILHVIVTALKVVLHALLRCIVHGRNCEI